MQRQIFKTELAGKTLTVEHNDLAPQANGSIMVRYGETVILVTVVMSERESTLPYFPLSVEFEEKFYAAGAILGSRFVRREGRPSDDAVLSARIVDRTIRPLFPTGVRREVQVIVTVLAIGEDDPDVLAVLGTSIALGISDIPWNGPVGAVRIGRERFSGRFVVNPTYTQRSEKMLDLEVLACGKGGHINMIETAGDEVAEDIIIDALTEARSIHSTLEQFQADIIASLGKPKLSLPITEPPATLTTLFESQFHTVLYTAIFSNRPGKAHIYEVKQSFLNTCATTIPEVDISMCSDYFETKIDEVLHAGVVLEGKRPDGRPLDAVRPLFAQAGGISPVLHGSGIFYRGDTHIFSALTLGGPDAAQLIDTMEAREEKKRFMHHYNFPPFSVGETGRVGGFNRRMLGHGALAEKALLPVIPPIDNFPYTIRLVSETLSSNGSSSMGSVCASSIALMDGGVPISRAVAGIASGVMFYEGKYALLTDIQGPEDEFGDMDFKVAGTTVGITAIQMDVKVDGIPLGVLAEALERARVARLTILDVMNQAIAAPRDTRSPRAPEIMTLRILPEQIGLVIGSGGKTINGIKADTNVEEITIEDDGTIFITGKNGTARLAADRIRSLTRRYEIGEHADAIITRIAPFGAFAKLDAYNEGLIHISEVGNTRIETLDDLLTIGETVPVVVTKIEDGKIGLSIKRRTPDFLERRSDRKI